MEDAQACRRREAILDLRRSTEGRALPEYFVVPEKWIQKDIDAAYAAYLKRHGGKRARTPGSTHHAIRKDRVEQWRDRWDLLGIF